MANYTVASLANALNKLKVANRLTSDNVLLYVLQPFVQSLNYDLFDPDIVDSNSENGVMNITVDKNISIVISQSAYAPNGLTDKIFLYLDTDENFLELQMKSLDEWERLYHVDLNKAKEQESKKMYEKIIKYVERNSLLKMYAEKGERVFSEGALRALLVSGKPENRFTYSVVAKLFKNPSPALLEVIADELLKDYTTDTKDQLMVGLQQLQGKGLYPLVSTVVENYMEDSEVSSTYEALKPYTEYTNPYEQKESVIVEEPTEEEVEEEVAEELDEAVEVDEDVESEYASILNKTDDKDSFGFGDSKVEKGNGYETDKYEELDTEILDDEEDDGLTFSPEDLSSFIKKDEPKAQAPKAPKPRIKTVSNGQRRVGINSRVESGNEGRKGSDLASILGKPKKPKANKGLGNLGFKKPSGDKDLKDLLNKDK